MRRTFALLRRVVDATARNALRAHVLEAAILNFVQCGQLGRIGFQVRELPVMPDRAHEKRFLVLWCAVNELELRGILLLVSSDRFRRVSPLGVDGVPCLEYCGL
jgi:hypothetical protein